MRSPSLSTGALRRPALLLHIAGAAAFALVLACDRADPPVHTNGASSEVPAASTPVSADESDGPVFRSKTYVSNAFHIYKKWKSMEGPMDLQRLNLTQPKRPELLWLTGYRVSIIPGDGEGQVSQEFMCHNNLDFKAAEHAKMFGWTHEFKGISGRNRVFTLSQGQFDVALPEGFGIPIRSDEELQLTTQVLNHNEENPDLQVRHQVEIGYARDADLETPLKPLYQQPIFVMASLEDTEVYWGVADPDSAQEGSSCAVGEHKGLDGHIYKDEFGRKFTGHWVVEPGREERRTLVTEQLDLSFDTRIHFIGVHLHPFAESLTLRDLTTGENVWTANASGPEGRIGLSSVDYYSSPEGIPLYKDHDYELISVYDNTSGVEQDAMATLFLYLYDEEGAKGVESLRRIAKWAAEAES